MCSVRFRSLADILAKAPGWLGAEKTLEALVSRLLNKYVDSKFIRGAPNICALRRKFSSSHKQIALTALIDARETPTSIIKHICTSLLEDLSLEEPAADDLSYKRELVGDIHQRRHDAYQDSVNSLLESVGGQQRESLERLVLTAALVRGYCSCNNDI